MVGPSGPRKALTSSLIVVFVIMYTGTMADPPQNRP